MSFRNQMPICHSKRGSNIESMANSSKKLTLSFSETKLIATKSLKLENKTNPLTALPFRLSPVEKPRKRAPVKNSKQTKTKTNNKKK